MSSLGIFQDRIFGIHHRVRRQPALGFAQAHGAARGMQADSHLAGGLDFVIQARAVGEQVQMVGGGRAAGEGQLAQSSLCGHKHMLRRQARPDRVERLLAS